MKIARLSTAIHEFYPRSFYAKHPDLNNKTYEEQQRALNWDAHRWVDSWTLALQPHGYEVLDITPTIQPLQKAWADENKVPFDLQCWIWDIPVHQIKKFQPDILFFEDFQYYSPQWIQDLRAKCPTIRKVFGWCDSPFRDLSLLKAYDIALCTIPEWGKQLSEQNLKVIHFRHAFDPRILERIEAQPEASIDFSFIGQIARLPHGHGEREKFLKELVKFCEISIFSPEAEVTWSQDLKSWGRKAAYSAVRSYRRARLPEKVLTNLPGIRRAAGWDRVPFRARIPELKRFFKPAVFGLDMFQTLSNSRLTWNFHIDLSPLSANNMRLYEATGMGTCLVTDWKQNLAELFEPDREVVTYRSVEECAEKVRWLLDHRSERDSTARAGQARTLKDHTFTQRAIEFDHIIRQTM